MITEFEKGKWYEATTGQILKYSEPYSRNTPFGIYEWFSPEKKYYKEKTLHYTDSPIKREVPIEEIKKFLPKGHPDLEDREQLLSTIIL